MLIKLALSQSIRGRSDEFSASSWRKFCEKKKILFYRIKILMYLNPLPTLAKFNKNYCF